MTINKDEMLGKIKEIIQQQSPGAEVYLFGSRVRGEESSESDWDVLILVDTHKITRELEKKITYPLYDLAFDTGEVISPMVYTRRSWHTEHKITPFY